MNKIIAMTISVVIAICMVSVVVIPIIESGQNSFTKTEKTVLDNEGTPLIKGNVGSEYNVQWDSALPGMIKVNGTQVTVYFSAGTGATVSPSSKTVTVDLTYGDLPIPTRTGYTFDGWFTSQEYTTEVTETTVVPSGHMSITLYAKWK